MKIEQFITDYLQREYTIAPDVDLHTLNYVEQGYVDSIGMLNFVVALEDEFGISFTDEEMASSVFKIVGTLAALIQKKQV